VRPFFIAALVVAVGCTSPNYEANPPTLWLAMNTGQTGMVLIGEEPHPY
jgi:hypothetical protein